MRDDGIDISVIMPCMDEELTVGPCIDEAKRVIDECGLIGEIVVVDNGSQDCSADKAREHGAVVVGEERTGYGHAIRRGIDMAQGKIIIIADCDMTYDFDDMKKITEMMNDGGYDMVIGDRFSGTIEKGAMPLSHRIGVKVLSALGRRRFKTDVNDFHCGIRGSLKDALCRLEFQTGGMEFATEMIAVAAENHLMIGQTPVRLRKCLLQRRSKLRTVRDGLRHLKYILRGGGCN